MNTSLLQRLAGVGAIGVAVVLLALFALVIFISAPSGIDPIESFVTRVSVGLVLLLMVLGHLVYARILLRAARGERFGP